MSTRLYDEKGANFKKVRAVSSEGCDFPFWDLGGRREIEDWNPGITFLDDWSYFDALKKKLVWLTHEVC